MARGTRGRRADYDWQAQAGSITALDLTAGASSIIAMIAFLQASTMVRIRGEAFVQLNAAAANERTIIALGLLVTTDEAVAAGGGSIPEPFDDAESPWVWHSFASVSSGAEAAVVSDGLFARVPIDSKAMRRVKQNETLVFVAEIANTPADQGGTVDILAGVRVLTAQ